MYYFTLITFVTAKSIIRAYPRYDVNDAVHHGARANRKALLVSLIPKKIALGRLWRPRVYFSTYFVALIIRLKNKKESTRVAFNQKFKKMTSKYLQRALMYSFSYKFVRNKLQKRSVM